MARRTMSLDRLWKMARAWAELNGHKHDAHNVHGVGAL